MDTAFIDNSDTDPNTLLVSKGMAQGIDSVINIILSLEQPEELEEENINEEDADG